MQKNPNQIQLNILNHSYWEHFKKAKDLALIYPPNHIERKRLDDVMKHLITRINQLKKKDD